jgi:hypothetical protein
MNDDSETADFFRLLFICIGSYLIGSEYGTALGWGVWFIAIALD